MSDGGNSVPRITKAEHIGPNDTGDNIEAKRVALYAWDGSNWQRVSSSNPVPVDTELPTAAVLADNTVNPTAPAVGSHILGYDGTTWDRLKSTSDNADNVSVTTSGVALSAARGYVFDGTTWDRMPGDTTGVKIQDGGNSITVDGTIAATQSGVWTVGSYYNTRSDTYTGTANGTTVDISTRPLKSYSVQVKGTGAAATTWDVRLEGSLDGTNFSQILQHTNTTGDGATLWATTLAPCLYFRSRCTGLVLGSATNIIVTILGAE